MLFEEKRFLVFLLPEADRINKPQALNFRMFHTWIIFYTQSTKNFFNNIPKNNGCQSMFNTSEEPQIISLLTLASKCIDYLKTLTKIFLNIWTSRFRRCTGWVFPVAWFREAHVQVGKTDGAAYSCHALVTFIWQQLLGATQACSSGAHQLLQVSPTPLLT
jgi:hypothetical protein